VSEVRSPTLRRRELGALLRTLRQDRGMTVEQVAEQLLCSLSKVSRMETGQRGVTLRDIRDLCRIYGVTDETQVSRLTTLAREGKQQGWWQSHELDYFATYVGLEEAATTLFGYQSSIVHGLLQTVDYARAMYKAGLPAEFTLERAEELIRVRLRRQEVLTRNSPLRVFALLDEAALHRVVGGPEVMGAQLEHLVEVASLPNVTLGVMPYSAGAHPAMDNAFSILDFANVAPTVVYVEGLMGWLYIERPQEVERYQQVFEYLCAMALGKEDTIELIRESRKRYSAAPVSRIAWRSK
jgi:transcriptional regulator with XRE-family HTH domain